MGSTVGHSCPGTGQYARRKCTITIKHNQRQQWDVCWRLHKHAQVKYNSEDPKKGNKYRVEAKRELVCCKFVLTQSSTHWDHFHIGYMAQCCWEVFPPASPQHRGAFMRFQRFLWIFSIPNLLCSKGKLGWLLCRGGGGFRFFCPHGSHLPRSCPHSGHREPTWQACLCPSSTLPFSTILGEGDIDINLQGCCNIMNSNNVCEGYSIFEMCHMMSILPAAPMLKELF